MEHQTDVDTSIPSGDLSSITKQSTDHYYFADAMRFFSLLLAVASISWSSSSTADRAVLAWTPTIPPTAKTSSSSSSSSVPRSSPALAPVPRRQQDRRSALIGTGYVAATVAAVTAMGFVTTPSPALAAAEPEADSIFAPKFVQEYPDFIRTDEGWSYRDVSIGTGAKPQMGDRCVYDFSGYTIGYFGRPFEAKGGPQGGAFDKEPDYSRTVLGSGEIIKGLECAMLDMKVGGVRQVLVPYGDLSYPSTSVDGSHDKVGPKPSTFSGLRALNFVLDNPRVDRTLLFNVKLLRVDKRDDKGGFKRGDKVV